MPEPSEFAIVRHIESPPGLYSYLDWLDEETLAVQYRPGLMGALSARIWRLSVDGRSFEEMELPKHPSCGAEGQNGFEAPSRLPDGRMGYVVACQAEAGPSEITMFLMAFDPISAEVEQLLEYPLPTFSVGTGGFMWNPTMDLGIMGNGRAYIDEQLYWYRISGWEPLDVGLVQAYGPSWSPDGMSIAFIGSEEEGSPRTFSNYGLFLMNSDGGSPRVLLEGFHDTAGVSYSPDGQSLVFPGTFGAREGDRQGLWLYDLPTGRLKQLAEGVFGEARWAPDGERMAVVQFLGPPGREREHRVAIIEVGPNFGR